MADHYPPCPVVGGCICEALSEHTDTMIAAYLADLRAKVEGLRDESARELGSNLSRNEISERVGEDTAYAAVLALIDEVR